MNPDTKDSLPPKICIRHYLKPGDIGYLTYLHGIVYAKEYGWDHTFEAYVGGPLSEFANSKSESERIWILEKEQEIIGSVAIVKNSTDTAQLRWLLLLPAFRGHGIGRFLVEEAIRFCRDSGYSSVFLWTVSDLTAAANLYRSVGFRLTQKKSSRLWGTRVTEQRFDLRLKP